MHPAGAGTTSTSMHPSQHPVPFNRIPVQSLLGTSVQSLCCSFCSKSYASGPKLQLHINKSHSSPPRLPCPHCSNTYKGPKGLLSHIAIHHTRGTAQIFCEKCTFVTTSQIQYRDHFRETHLRCHACKSIPSDIAAHEKECSNQI